jgi:23S rRNA (guanine745-N1)-methyltransferase
VAHDGGVLGDILPYLVCPICEKDLAASEGRVRCANGHSFDVARQGYINLLPGGALAGTADTAAMVQARADFLAEGHFASLAELLADRVAAAIRPTAGTPTAGTPTAGTPTAGTPTAGTPTAGTPTAGTPTAGAGCVLDAGAGTGYYLAAALERSTTAVGLACDISKFAARKAARAHPRLGAVVCDVWRTLPVRSGIADAVLNVFAPRNAAEFRRVLRPDGVLLLITPTARHLEELVRPLRLLSVDDEKTQRIDSAVGDHFTLAAREDHEIRLRLDHRAAETLALMGPSAWHLTAAKVREGLADVADPVSVRASFTLSVYRPVG